MTQLFPVFGISCFS